MLYTVTSQAPLSTGFSRREYWNEWPFPPPGDHPDPGIKPMSPASPSLAGRFFTTVSTWEACGLVIYGLYYVEICFFYGASLVAQLITNLPAMEEIPVQFLGWEYPLEKDVATHSGILAWTIPMDRGAWWSTANGGSKNGSGLSD